MSRSVKRTPVCNDHDTPSTRLAKRIASKTVRRFKGEVQGGKWYRKLYCSWNICDYRFYRTKRQALHEWETSRWRWNRSLSKSQVLNDWEKSFRRK